MKDLECHGVQQFHVFVMIDWFGIGLDQKERLAQQKQQLNKRLGLDMAGGLGVNTDDFYREEDLILNRQDSTTPQSVLPQVGILNEISI